MLILADSKNAGTKLLCNWRMTILVLTFLRFLFVFHGLTCIIFIAGTEKGSEHTWFWRDEGDGGADLLYCLCSLLRRSVSPLLFLCSSIPLLVQPCFVFHFFSLVFRSELFPFSPLLFLTLSLLLFFFRMAPSPSLSLLLFRFSAPPSPLPFFFFSSPSRGGLYSLNNSSI